MRKIITLLILIAFSINSIVPMGYAQGVASMPPPGTMVSLSTSFNPLMLKGIRFYPDNPFKYDFIVDTGDSRLQGEALKKEISRLVKYFLATLAVDDEDRWVNLSPYEKDRIIPEKFGETQMGRDLLAQDYLLKQAASLASHPEKELGQKFWARLYEKLAKGPGTVDVPVDIFNKVWIMPQKAHIYQHGAVAFIAESSLKVMMESDYLAMKKQAAPGRESPDETTGVVVSTMKEIILPEIEKEVNQGKDFSQVRQVYSAMVLATWLKRKIKDSVLGRSYVGKNMVRGVDIQDKQEKEKIYRQYLEAVKAGAYNLIREDVDPLTQETVPRRYFSGGVQFTAQALDNAMTSDDKNAKEMAGALEGQKSGELVTSTVAFKPFFGRRMSRLTLAAALALSLVVMGDKPKNQKFNSALNILAEMYFAQGKANPAIGYGVFFPLIDFLGEQNGDIMFNTLPFTVEEALPFGERGVNPFFDKLTPAQQEVLAQRLVGVLSHYFSEAVPKIKIMRWTGGSIRDLTTRIDLLDRIALKYPGLIMADPRLIAALQDLTLLEFASSDFNSVHTAGMTFFIDLHRSEPVEKLVQKYLVGQDMRSWNMDELGFRVALAKIVVERGGAFADADFFKEAQSFLSGEAVLKRWVELAVFYGYMDMAIENLIPYQQERILREYFDIRQAGVLGDNDLERDLVLAGTLGLGSSWSVLYKEHVLAFLRSVLQQEDEGGIVRAIRIYNTVSSVNSDWTNSLMPEFIRILEREGQHLPQRIDEKNFFFVTQYYELSDILRNTIKGGLPQPEADEYLARLSRSGVVDKKFVANLSPANTQEIALAVSFLDKFPGGDGLIRDFLSKFMPIVNFQDISRMEDFRREVNKINPILGDQLFITIGGHYVDQEYSPEALGGSSLWEKFGYAKRFLDPEGISNKDVTGLYRLMGNFMMSRVSDHLQLNRAAVTRQVGKEKAAEMSAWLQENRFVPEKISAARKLAQQLIGGNIRYLGFRARTWLMSGPEAVDQRDLVINTNMDFPMEGGVTVEDMRNKKTGEVIAHVLRVDPARGARVIMRADVGRRNGGVTGEGLALELNERGRLIFDAPVSFTTGDAKPTEILIEDGKVRSYLISTEGKDAFIIIQQDGSVHVADKRDLWVHDIDPEIAPALDGRLDITHRIGDYNKFLELARKKKISLVSNMLLFDGKKPNFINDGPDQRRFFLVFKDGSFGIINSAKLMSTGEATRLAIAAGAVRVVYMDTGQFDYARIRPVGKPEVVWGHSDQKASSNRLGIYMSGHQQEPGVDHAMSLGSRDGQPLGGIDMSSELLNLSVESDGLSEGFNVDYVFPGLVSLEGLSPVILKIAPTKFEGLFAGIK